MHGVIQEALRYGIKILIHQRLGIWVRCIREGFDGSVVFTVGLSVELESTEIGGHTFDVSSLLCNRRAFSGTRKLYELS